MGCTYHTYCHPQDDFGYHHHHHHHRRPHHHRVICLVGARGTIRAWRYTANTPIIIFIRTMIIIVMKKMLVFWSLQKDSDLNLTTSNNSDDNTISNVELKYSLQLMGNCPNSNFVGCQSMNLSSAELSKHRFKLCGLCTQFKFMWVLRAGAVWIYNRTKCAGHRWELPIFCRFLARVAFFWEIVLPKRRNVCFLLANIIAPIFLPPPGKYCCPEEEIYLRGCFLLGNVAAREKDTKWWLNLLKKWCFPKEEIWHNTACLV